MSNLPLEICEDIFIYLPFEKVVYLSERIAKKLYNRNKHTIKWVVQNNYIGCLKWLYKRDHYFCISYAMFICIEYGKLEMLQWLYKLKSNADCSTHILHYKINLAARYNHLDIIKWLDGQGETFSYLAIQWAAENGYLEIVKWLCSKFTELIPSLTLDLAAGNGHLDIIKWFYENRKEICSSLSIDLAARNGHLDIIKWLYYEKNIETTIFTMSNAAEHGHLDIIKWLYSHTRNYCIYLGLQSAAANNHVHIVDWFLLKNSTCNCRNH